ncbi:MAG: SDR family NAD(P)-dependent oxidoreductase [Thermodesulfobacteriota bacterium]
MPGIKNLKDKVVVVTGAGSGIGRATAKAFAGEGARMVLADISRERLDNLQKTLQERDIQAAVFALDVSDKKQVADLAQFTLDTYGRVDIIHNNAGIGMGGPLEVFPLEDWERIVGVNFWSVVYGVHYFLPHMIRQRSGHIVNTSSAAGYWGLAGLGAYTATKHAIIGYSDVLRAEIRRYNIGVTTICPGVIKTSIVHDGKQTMLPTAKIDQKKMAAFYDRFGWSPERVARAVIKGVKKNRGLVPVSPEAWVMWYVKRLSETAYNLFLRIAARSAW